MFRAVPLIMGSGWTQPLGLIQNSHKVQLSVVKIKRVQGVTYLSFRRRVQGRTPSQPAHLGVATAGIGAPCLEGPIASGQWRQKSGWCCCPMGRLGCPHCKIFMAW